MIQKRILLSFLFSILCMTGCAPSSIKHIEAKGKKRLNTKQLQGTFSGTTLHLESIDFDAEIVLHPDGTLSGKDIGGSKDKGKWSITEKDQLCLRWKTWYFGDRKCYLVYREKTSRYAFFTHNGVRYYNAVLADRTGTIPSGKRNNPKSALETAEFSKSTVDPEENRRRLIRLARNCPDCNLSESDFRGANLIGANLSGANLTGSDFTDANLRRANLRGANLTNGILVRTNLPGADLTGCDLTHADLSGSNLIRAKVHGAKFKGAVLSGAHINNIQGTIDTL